MCALAGWVSPAELSPTAEQVVERMADQIAYRGPDERGRYADPRRRAVLAHRRLSIIDLATGRQPLSNEDGSVWAIVNGEIYNYEALRTELEEKGHRFRTASDSEVVPHLYEEYGVECVQHLRGMFAVAVWDERQGRLLLARDRTGQKPLVYARHGGELAFASEPKALLAWPHVSREMDPLALHEYLTLGYVAAPRSMFADIEKLPPAHRLVWERGVVSVERYWSLAYRPKWSRSRESAIAGLRSVIEEAVRLRMVSDVPLGAFLSGGIDSSIVVAVMSQLSTQSVRTFTIGFDDEEYTEVQYARQVAERYATDHREFTVRAEAADILPKLIWLYNEPFGDSSCIPTYYLSQLTREHVTVALNGDGGDESFAGYERYRGYLWSRRMTWCPSSVWNSTANVLEAIERRRGRGVGRPRALAYARAFTRAMADYPDPALRYARWISYCIGPHRNALYTPELWNAVSEAEPLEYVAQAVRRHHAEAPLDQVMAADIRTYLPEDLLVKVDIATMAHALEGRSPFLDHHVMEFAAQLPVTWKLRGRYTKALLKDAYRADLPEPILHRRKMGFGVPLATWFRGTLGKQLLESVHEMQGLRTWIRPEGIQRLLVEHRTGQADHRFRLWALLNLVLWYRQFIDGASEMTSHEPSAALVESGGASRG